MYLYIQNKVPHTNIDAKSRRKAVQIARKLNGDVLVRFFEVKQVDVIDVTLPTVRE